MKKKFTFLTAALALLAFLALPMGMRGQTATFSPSDFSGQGVSGGGSNSAISATVNGVTFACDNGYGTTQIRCYKNSTITISSSNTITAISFSFSGTYTGGLETSYSDLSTNSWSQTLGSQARIMECSVTYSTGGGSQLTPCDLALVDAPVELEFDLYDNDDPQTISYTTSSTGEVTVSQSNYITATVNANNTITVTPVAVTNGPQTITVNQASDGTYAAGSVTFTVDIEDSTPSTGLDVTFDATLDIDLNNTTQGEGTIEKDGVTFTCNSGILGNGTEYRLYKNSITTFSVTTGTITKIVFTCTSGNPANGFADLEGLTFNGNNGTWIGDTTTIAFEASNKQVRATKIVVTVEGGGIPDPYFTITSNEVIAYDTTSGSFNFTLNYPVENGILDVTEEVEWIDEAEINTLTEGYSVTFATTVNPTAVSREGIITLTYAYEGQTVTKDVTVTQAANPNVVDNISGITEVDHAYTVKGTVVAINSRGFIMGDGTGYVYYYKGSNAGKTVGDMVKVSGTTSSYGHVIQFPSAATVVESTTSNYQEGTPAATVITEVPDYTEGLHLSTYLEFEGALTKSSSNYFITLGEAQIQISYPTTTQGTTLTALDGKTVHVKGYFSGINSSNFFSVVLESAEEVQSTEPSITFNPDVIDLDAEQHIMEIPFTYENIEVANYQSFTVHYYNAEGEEIQLVQGEAWYYFGVTGTNDNGYKASGVVMANEDEARSAYFKVSAQVADSTVYSNLVTINQEAPAAPVTEGTIVFGNNGTKINADEVTGDDSMGNTWTITTVGTTSFTQNAGYSQVGSGSNPATSITFTTTLPQASTITAFSAKFGGYNNTAGDVSLYVGETIVGTGSLDGSNDVVVENTSTGVGTVLTVTVTNIAKGVKCYYISYSIDLGTDPMISAPNTVNLSSTDTYAEFGYSIINPVDGQSLIATSTDEWISNINVTDDKVNFVTTINTNETEDRQGTITLTYGEITKNVTVIQSKVDYATLPLDFDGGKNELPTGLTANLGSDYGNSPKLGFRNTDNYLIMKLSEAPVSLSYDIKGNSFSGGTFDVMTSADGITYESLATYTELEATVQTITHIDLASTVRYIKWVYTNKSSGNVALGNIHASTNYDIYGNVAVENLTIAADKVCTVYSPAVLDVTTALTNNGTAASLIIEDGAQLKTPNAVQGTIQKFIAGYGAENVNTNLGYYLLKSPVPGTFNLDCALAAGMVNGTVDNPDFTGIDLYEFSQQKPGEEWQNQKINSSFATFGIAANAGYLYANVDTVTLSFATYNDDNGDHLFRALTNDSILAMRYNTTSPFIGWSLIGNPFTCNAYLATGRDFYRMNATGDAIVLATTDKVIKPCEGIFVVVEENDPETWMATQGNTIAQIHFTTTEPQRINALMDVTVSRNGETLDAARVRFNNGGMVNKMVLNGNATRLSIAQGSKDYSVVRSEGENEMPVNFKAGQNGTYTISINTDNVEMNYLHLIDNMTGADVDLLANPNYSFEANTNDYANRFRLVFKANASISENVDAEGFAFFNGSTWTVSNLGEATLQVVDMTGRVLSSETVDGNAEISINQTPGVYMLRLINGENVRTQKVVVR